MGKFETVDEKRERKRKERDRQFWIFMGVFIVLCLGPGVAEYFLIMIGDDLPYYLGPLFAVGTVFFFLYGRNQIKKATDCEGLIPWLVAMASAAIGLIWGTLHYLFR